MQDMIRSSSGALTTTLNSILTEEQEEQEEQEEAWERKVEGTLGLSGISTNLLHLEEKYLFTELHVSPKYN